MNIPTVIIQTENGPVQINASEFDASKHTIAENFTPDNAPVTPSGVQSAEQMQAAQTILRDDGPTVAEYVTAGYDPADYPPAGYLSRSTPEEIATAVAAKAQTPPPAPVQPAPPVQGSEPAAKPLVAQFGERFFIVDKEGNKLSGKGISPRGYADGAAAWDAVSKLEAAE